jgi:hypothetical protein
VLTTLAIAGYRSLRDLVVRLGICARFKSAQKRA